MPTMWFSRLTGSLKKIILITVFPVALMSIFNAMSMPDLLKEVKKVDDHTVKFVLNRPEAPMIANLAMGLCLDSLSRIR